MYPDYLSEEKINTISSEFSKDLPVCIKFDKKPDIYYLKLLIIKYLYSSMIDDDAELLYLDYDHICLHLPILPMVNDKNIYVSSEVADLKLDINNYISVTNYAKQNFNKHHNTSFIYGKCSTLKQATKNWIKNYNLLNGYVPERYLEEISFSIASLQANLKVIPVNTKIQSSFSNYNLDCALFHYGGEHKLSNLIKKILTQEY